MAGLRRAASVAIVCAGALTVVLGARSAARWREGRTGDATLTPERDALTSHVDGRRPAPAFEGTAAQAAAAGAAAVVREQDRVVAERLPPAADPGAERTQVLAAAFRRMHAMSSYFNREALRRAEMRGLLDDPETLEVAGRVVVDPGYASAVFGGEQAEARVYSIMMLAEAARLGDERPLKDAVRTLAASLSTAATEHRAFGRAQDRDLADLLDAAVAPLVEQPADALASGLGEGLRELGYRPTMAPEVRKIYDDAVFQPLLARLGRAEASRLVAAALTEEEAH